MRDSYPILPLTFSQSLNILGTTGGKNGMGKLTALSVRSAKTGRHGDGDGLYLVVSPKGSKSWIVRVVSEANEGKRRDIGIGSAVSGARTTADISENVPLLQRRILTLREAREKARLVREFAKAGLDPQTERDKNRSAVPTFEVAARAAHVALEGGWSEKVGKAFLSTLERHVFPKIGAMRVSDVDSDDIRRALLPIWIEKPVQARKVRQRLNLVLNFANARGWRATEAPSSSVQIGLPKQPAGGDFRAMPYADVPAFFQMMVPKPETAGRLALRFLILTAARPGEVRTALWNHIDLEKGLWSRPASLMKQGRDHIVTLNAPAIAMLSRIHAYQPPKPTDLIFPGRGGKQLSDMTLTKVLENAEFPYVPYGFRSAFKDWCAEQMPGTPDAVAEAALSDVVQDEVARAYFGSTFLELRRELLEAWGQFVAGTGV